MNNFKISPSQFANITFSILFFTIFGSKNVFGQAPALQKYQFVAQKMGAAFQIQIFATDSILASNAASHCFSMVDSLNHIFSDYKANSEINTLANNYVPGQWYTVSAALYDLLQISQQAYYLSRGSFDVSLGQLTQLWRQSKRNKQLPTKHILAQKRKEAGFEHIKLATDTHTIRIDRPYILFDFGGIAKGYAAQKCLEYLQKAGYEYSLVNAAGNMAIGRHPVANWYIAVENWPKQLLQLQQSAISTSGNNFQFIAIGNRTFSHILDPTTGLGMQHNRQVSIICASATTADWLSTACSVLKPKAALKLANKQNAEILILEKTDKKMKIWQSKRFFPVALN